MELMTPNFMLCGLSNICLTFSRLTSIWAPNSVKLSWFALLPRSARFAWPDSSTASILRFRDCWCVSIYNPIESGEFCKWTRSMLQHQTVAFSFLKIVKPSLCQFHLKIRSMPFVLLFLIVLKSISNLTSMGETKYILWRSASIQCIPLSSYLPAINTHPWREVIDRHPWWIGSRLLFPTDIGTMGNRSRVQKGQETREHTWRLSDPHPTPVLSWGIKKQYLWIF